MLIIIGEFTRFIWWMQNSSNWLQTLRPGGESKAQDVYPIDSPQAKLLGMESVWRLLSSTPTSQFSITHSESSYSFYRPTEGSEYESTQALQYRCASRAKVVYCNGFLFRKYAKCPQYDWILEISCTTLPLDHCDVRCSLRHLYTCTPVHL